MSALDFAAIRAANPLPEAARAAGVKLTRRGDEWAACCPFHRDRTPSFTIYAAGERFWCFGCGASGDVLDFVRLTRGTDIAEAARMLARGDIPRISGSSAAGACAGQPGKPDTMAAAKRIWQHACPAAGTLAETYLRCRGIEPPFPPDIRFAMLSADGLAAMPCLVAAVRDVAGIVTGIQRIFLAADGSGKAALDTPKRSLGQVKGGAIRLGEPRPTVTVCEGPEDGLSLLAMLGPPVWVAAGATFLPAMQFPADVRAITIAADNDAAGQRQADKAARAFALRGLAVRIIHPLPGFKDFNDELKGGRNGNRG